MKDVDFFSLFLNEYPLFLFLMLISTIILYISVKKEAIAGYFDPIHFVWTFTFGTAYGIVIGLFVLGHISNLLFTMVTGYALIFILSFKCFLKVSIKKIISVFSAILIPKKNGRKEFYCALVILILLWILIINLNGFGLFAEINRFEHNRGFGMFIRLADALGPFVSSYLSLLLYNDLKKNKLKIMSSQLILLIFIIVIIIVGSVVNGAKMALLNFIYSIFVAITIFDKRPKFNFIQISSIFIVVLSFALIALSINLDKTSISTENTEQYFNFDSFILDRLALRILANADKYYFSLPNNVIDEIETDNLTTRLLSPLIGTTKLSAMLEYDVSEYDVGRQIILYHYPTLEAAGGPTSHFDLFVYKYFNPYFGWLWVSFMAFLLACIIKLARSDKGNIFHASLVSVLWLRGLSILIEPAVGLAYIIDIFVVFIGIRLLCLILPKSLKNE